MYIHSAFSASKIRKSLLALLIAALLNAALFIPPASYATEQKGGPSDPKETEAFIDSFFNRADIQAKLAGAVIAVVKDDRTLLAKGYGYADAERQTAVDPDQTLFRLASLSKTFTATAVMQLAEQHQVDLDRDIGGYLNGLRIPNITGAPLTLKHLMTHTSGFDQTEAETDEGAPQDVYPLEAFVKDNLPTVIRKPGEAFRYDNYAYDLLGFIVQNVSGKPFDEVVVDRIFTPLGMTDSYLTLTPDVQKRLAVPHDGAGEPLPQYATFPNNSPDGGLISTGADMARFMQAELNGGKLGEASILSAQSIRDMQQLDVSIHPDIPGVGYGFESSFPEYANGQTVVDKAGVSSGFQAQMWLLPERKTGLFIALNSAQQARTIRSQLFKAFMDHYFPESPNPPQETVSPISQTKDQLRRLEGFYRDLRLPMWHYDVVAQVGGLLITDSYGTHRLKQIKELLFEDVDGRKAAFKDGGEGKLYFSYNKADSWSEKLPGPIPFSDVPDNHPYARFIYYVQQQGLLGKEDSLVFNPDQPITRAQFVGQLLKLSDIPLSPEPVSFADTAQSPYASEIQTALALGLVNGTTGDAFEPDRPIIRQEAAVIMARALLLGFGSAGAVPLEAALQGKTDDWALEGVQTVVARGYYGPEVVPDATGAVDYRSKQPMLRKEAAAMFYRFP
ncbi:beta-lactamase family protein [Paenibacillus sp. HWE-109]|uniref:beta-lactamase family protein n=1 Tax=Paenibacillus sp. HWE-109 TaxID=1306526 RepID=UPI001EE04CEC|nr:beta-lactamase family protein [Paenibacillus sp. HWE-109]UKS29350.1 beta-lactamase family protein [Paenibacillus sp. HWE-109]